MFVHGAPLAVVDLPRCPGTMWRSMWVLTRSMAANCARAQRQHPTPRGWVRSLWFGDMSVVSPDAGAQRDATPDPHIVELGKLILPRAPRLGKAMADLLCEEIDAYRDGSVVTKDEVAESCVANLTFVFRSLA